MGIKKKRFDEGTRQRGPLPEENFSIRKIGDKDHSIHHWTLRKNCQNFVQEETRLASSDRIEGDLCGHIDRVGGRSKGRQGRGESGSKRIDKSRNLKPYALA